MHVAPRSAPRITARLNDRPTNTHNAVRKRIAASARPSRPAPESLLDIRCRVLRAFRNIERIRILAARGNSARQRAWDEKAEFTQRNTEAVDDNGADDQEPDDHVHDFDQVRSVFSRLAVDFEFVQELDADIEVESGAYADGAKETNKECLSLLFDLMDLLVHSEDDGRAAEKQD